MRKHTNECDTSSRAYICIGKHALIHVNCIRTYIYANKTQANKPSCKNFRCLP